jgi:guanine deaminase
MQVFTGSFIWSKSLDELELLHDAAVFVDDNGKIVKVVEDVKGEPEEIQNAVEKQCKELGWTSSTISVRTCKPGQFFFPGFIGKYH